MEEKSLDDFIKRLVEENDPQNIDSWLTLIVQGNQAMRKSRYAEADEIFKQSVIFAEENMSPDAIMNALLCLAASYHRQDRLMEATTAYARAQKIVEENAHN